MINGSWLEASHVLEDASATEILQWASTEFGSGLVVTSSLADTVMIHLAERVAPGIDVIFLDTGYHFAETLGTRDAVAAVHNVNLISLTADHTPAEQDAIWGKDLFATNRTSAAPRKTQPLDRALTIIQRGPAGSGAPTLPPAPRRRSCPGIPVES